MLLVKSFIPSCEKPFSGTRSNHAFKALKHRTNLTVHSKLWTMRGRNAAAEWDRPLKAVGNTLETRIITAFLELV